MFCGSDSAEVFAEVFGGSVCGSALRKRFSEVFEVCADMRLRLCSSIRSSGLIFNERGLCLRYGTVDILHSRHNLHVNKQRGAQTKRMMATVRLDTRSGKWQAKRLDGSSKFFGLDALAWSRGDDSVNNVTTHK